MTPTTTMRLQGNTQANAGELRSPRSQWIDAFSIAMLTLNPHWGSVRTHRMACDLWAEVGHFDPALAAELEYESSLCDA